jgi:hypothetical protein
MTNVAREKLMKLEINAKIAVSPKVWPTRDATHIVSKSSGERWYA